MTKIKWMGTLLIVSDLQKSKAFYQNVLGQETIMDTPEMVSFGNHEHAQLSLSPADYFKKDVKDRWLTVKMKTSPKTNNFQLYFEVEDLEAVAEKIKAVEGIELIYDVGENFSSFPQRGIRFYDFDGHLIEVAESLQVLARRLLAQGMNIEEVAEQFGDSVETIQEILKIE
ncbi:MAG: VOC family protein [Dysgonamonadaceae bacterium]|jgi:catechol 2,3-dioxygenase-like lactoylglutathione lyase family enzyme|nr:VOC family protein [Dysgonamonadaceae bacterium]